MMKHALSALALFALLSGIVSAAYIQNPTTTAKVIYIETTFSQLTIAFGDVDADTTNNPALLNGLGAGGYTFTNTANSNTDVHAYLQATDMQDPTDTLTLAVSNLKVSLDAGRTDKFVSLVKSGGTPQWLDSNAASDGYIDALPAGSSDELWFWLDVPAIQTGADYDGTLTIKSMRPTKAP